MAGQGRITGLAGFMGWMTGFEPATSGSTIRRSNQLSYTHHEGFEES